MKFDSFINDICCDHRIKDGIFRLENQEHVIILQEYLEKAGYSINDIVNKTAKLFEAGRFPERQAYNKDGILVTFPTKEYRDRAVDKGTHFAENPKKNVGTLYSPSETGELSISDVSSTIQADGETTNQTDKSDTISLDQELDKKIVGTGSVDTRSTKEKVQDAQAVSAMLVSDVPLVNYTVDEAIRLGFYNKGFSWYDSNGDLIGEQVYDESIGNSVIQAEKKVAAPVKKPKATDLEYNLAKEINSYVQRKKFVTKDITAQILAKKLAEKEGITECDALGDQGCPIVDPLFAQLKKTSKTDCIFSGKKNMRTSLKDSSAQGCSAQNAEINAIVSTVLKQTGEDVKVMESITSFIMDGLEKRFYLSLEDDIKKKLHKSLTAVLEGASLASIKKDVETVQQIVKTNKVYVVNGEIPVDMNVTLGKINEVFNDPAKRYMLIEEMLTGKRRFSSGQGTFDAVCIADYMMTWNREGKYHLYTVQDFINQNRNNISFRFSNRGGVRGISIRSDLKVNLKEALNHTELNEGMMDTLKRIGSALSSTFSSITKEIDSLVGETKTYFTKVWESIKSGLQSIYELILKFGRFMKEIIMQGWTTFADWIGLIGHSDGTFVFQMPESIAAEPTDL